MKNILYIVLISCLLSCSNKITAPFTNVMNTEALHHKWKVTEMRGTTSLPDVYIDLRDILKTHASSGCDSIVFTPKYSYNNRVNFTHINIPLPNCSQNTLNSQLLFNLKDVHYFSVNSNQLRLLDKNQSKIFEAVYAIDDEQGSLLRRWQIASMLNADGDRLSKANPFIDFTTPGSASAYVGCNRFSIPVKITAGNGISMGNGASTKMFCEGDVNDEVFSKILPLVKMYQVVGNQLKLFDEYNTLLLEAVAPIN